MKKLQTLHFTALLIPKRRNVFNYMLLLCSAEFWFSAFGSNRISWKTKSVEGSAIVICNMFNVKDLIIYYISDILNN